MNLLVEAQGSQSSTWSALLNGRRWQSCPVWQVANQAEGLAVHRPRGACVSGGLSSRSTLSGIGEPVDNSRTRLQAWPSTPMRCGRVSCPRAGAAPLSCYSPCKARGVLIGCNDRICTVSCHYILLKERLRLSPAPR